MPHGGGRQNADWHVVPPEHTFPQNPQLLGSVWVSTHCPLQHLSGAQNESLQVVHAPPSQWYPGGQTLPQLPQLLLSVCGSAQMTNDVAGFGQQSWPAGQNV